MRDIKIVYVNCSLKECKKRDVKGMYKKAELGIIKEFTGVSSVFEEPKNPDIIVNTEEKNIAECVQAIIENLNHKI